MQNESTIQNLYEQFNNVVVMGCAKLHHRDPSFILHHMIELLLEAYKSSNTPEDGSLDETFSNAVSYMTDKLGKEPHIVAEELSKSLMDNFFEYSLLIGNK